MLKKLLILSFLCFFTLPVLADDEAPNLPAVFSSNYGRYYVKSVPDELYGPTNGKTYVYEVKKDEDKLIATFTWYSNKIYLEETPVGLSIVRSGPWHQGDKARKEDIALGFYLNDKLLKEYSTLDLAGNPDNVFSSISHYKVIQHIYGHNKYPSLTSVSPPANFAVKLMDNKIIFFDYMTGSILRFENHTSWKKKK